MDTETPPPFPKRQVIMMVAQSCNLNCKYCFQSNRTDGFMSADVAKRILSSEFEQVSQSEHTTRMEISFMGGEPLMNFPLIRDISEWIWAQRIGIPFELTVRTNGTLLSSEMENWFHEHKTGIDVGLSMDGLSRMNRLNRIGLPVNWQFFRENWPSKRVKVVLFRDSVQWLSATVRELSRANIPFEAVIGEGFEWTKSAASLLERELTELIPDYLERPEEAVECGLFSSRVADFFPTYVMRKVDFCGKSNNIIAYDVDGSPCICHLFSTPVIGYDKSRWAWSQLRDIRSVPFDPRCIVCPVQKNCKTCFGENLRLCGSIFESVAPTTICQAVKAKARACALLFLRRTEQFIKAGKVLRQDEQRDAEKALRILETFPCISTP